MANIMNYFHPWDSIFSITCEKFKRQYSHIGVTSASVYRLHLDHQRFLLPQCIYLLIQPILAFGTQFEIEIAEYFGEDDAHLVVGHTSRSSAITYFMTIVICLLLSQAVSRTHMERLYCGTLIIYEAGVAEPTFWSKRFGIFEHCGRMVHCPVRGCDCRLLHLISADL